MRFQPGRNRSVKLRGREPADAVAAFQQVVPEFLDRARAGESPGHADDRNTFAEMICAHVQPSLLMRRAANFASAARWTAPVACASRRRAACATAATGAASSQAACAEIGRASC